jgi:hypothetical protein
MLTYPIIAIKCTKKQEFNYIFEIFSFHLVSFHFWENFENKIYLKKKMGRHSYVLVQRFFGPVEIFYLE